MRLRFYNKTLVLAAAVVLAGLFALIFEARTLRKCVAVSKLQNAFSDIEQHLELQRSYIDELVLRSSGKDEYEIRRQISETAQHIDDEFAVLETLGKEEPSLGILPLRESWESLKGVRAEIASGRNMIKNNAISRNATIAFRQELLASLAQAEGLHSSLVSQVFRISSWSFAIIVILLGAILVMGWQEVIRPLRNIGSYLALNNPRGKAASGGTTIPEPADIEKDLRGLDMKSHEDMDAKDNFFASMSHEIRTPLNGVTGFLESLEETGLDAQQHQYLSLIKSSAKSLRRVIDDVLDLSKINSGKMELENVAFDMGELLEECVANATQSCRSKKDVKVIGAFTSGGKDAGEVIVRTDPMRIRQILDNLLSNAVKFTDHGQIMLAVDVTEPEEGMAEFGVSVKDTGIGMSSQELEKIFKPFSQASKSTARQYGGTGLGLLICDKLVGLLGGKLKVASRRMEGTEFSFNFRAPRAAAGEQLRLSGNFQVTLPPAELKNKFALLVDDTPTNLFLLETICQGTGLPYVTAQNGLEAVKRCSEDKFDIIFMDIQMPVMDGYTAMKEIRKLPNTGTTHIVALTASAYQEDVARALESGANSFIPKPFERDQLLMCIADALAITAQRSLRPSGCEMDESVEERQVRLMHDAMRERYRISLGEIKMILAQTAVDWRPVLDSLQAFSTKGQDDQVRAILHKLKGQLSSIGLQEYADMSAEIMEQMNAGNDCRKDIQELVENLSKIFKVLEKQVTIVS